MSEETHQKESADLLRIDAARNQHRYYHCAIWLGLFGDVSPVREFGRIGQPDQQRLHAHPDTNAAVGKMGELVQRKERWGTDGSHDRRRQAASGGEAMALYLDTETTGLRPPHDDLVEVALVDANGRRLINEVCRPAERWMCRGWPEAQAIHGLAPEHVADARPADAVRADVADLVRGADLVIYNARFDLGFSTGSCRSRQRAHQRRARHRANQGRLRQALRARARSPEGRLSPWLQGRRPDS